jgi:hypothetical protein
MQLEMTQREMIGYGTALLSVVFLAAAAWAKGSWPDALLAVGTGLGALAGAFGYANKSPVPKA